MKVHNSIHIFFINKKLNNITQFIEQMSFDQIPADVIVCHILPKLGLISPIQGTCGLINARLVSKQWAIWALMAIKWAKIGRQEAMMMYKWRPDAPIMYISDDLYIYKAKQLPNLALTWPSRLNIRQTCNLTPLWVIDGQIRATSITLCWCKLSYSYLVSMIVNAPNLSSLKLRFCEICDKVDTLPVLKKIDNLSLYNADIGNELIAALRPDRLKFASEAYDWPLLSTVKELKITLSITRIPMAASLTNIHALTIFGCTDGQLITIMNNNPNMRNIYI
jgi:hypothetical protein